MTKHALIVDDKEENLLYLRTVLEGTGWTVASARHGAEALVLARQKLPDLLVSDLLMPVMDGYTLLRHWKADPQLRAIPFIVYTATYTAAEDEQLAFSLGADGFLLKPTEPADFLTRIAEVLTRTAIVQEPVTSDDPGQLKLYSETLIRKLEEKSLQLERANQQLQQDLARQIQTEQELREREERLQMFLELGDVLRGRAADAMHVAMQIIGTHLRVQRCALVELHPDHDDVTVLAEHREHGPSLLGRHPLPPFARRLVTNFRLESGAVVVRDAMAELGEEERAELAPLGIAAFIGCPLLRDGVLRAVLVVGDAKPRPWNPAKAVLLRDLLGRCWTTVERDAIELELRRNKAMLEIAGRTAQLGGWSLELPDLQVTWSDEVCAIHEVPAGTRPTVAEALAFYAPECRDLVSAKVQACIDDGTPFDLEVELITAR